MSVLADLYDDEALTFGEIVKRHEKLCADVASILAEHGEIMTTFQTDGIYYITDDYRASRERLGVPVTPEEEVAIIACGRAWDAARAAGDQVPHAERWGPAWEATRALEIMRRPAIEAAEDHWRADTDGVPTTPDEVAARARYHELRDAAPPWAAEARPAIDAAHAAWMREIERAYDLAGVECPDGDEETERWFAECERRRATLARAKAGVTPIARPEDVTYEDEPEKVVRVPTLASVGLPGGASWDYGPDMTLADIAAAEFRHHERQREAERWKAETACERETRPLEPEET